MRKLFAALVLLACSNALWAQNIEQTLAVYEKQFQPERLHLHLDKSIYSPGETVWFKAYLMEGIYPAEGSKTLYVDFADDKGKTLSHLVFPIINGTASGQFMVPFDYTKPVINLRSYTKWMLNFDSSFIYKKQLPVIYQNPRLGSANNKVTFQPTLTFFPEGGDLVAGLNNKIAFKAHDQAGRPIEARGGIFNSKGKLIDSFKTIHNGLGYFQLVPATGETYSVKWRTNDKTERAGKLPAIKSNGVTLSVSAQGSTRRFTISRSSNASDELSELHVFGTMYGGIVFKADIKHNNLQSVGTIETAQFPSGILTFTVFDKHWKAIAERITYINNNEYRFEPEVGFRKLDLSKRGRNEVQIVLPDSLSAQLSISVTDAGIEIDKQQNIISQLLLSSELKGAIYNPAYYFTSGNDSVQLHLDLVMLTHGWRRFAWPDIAAGKLPPVKYQKDTSYLTLSGKVVGLMPSQIQEANSITLFVLVDSTRKVFSLPLKKDGSFSDDSFLFYDTVKVYYQLASKQLAYVGEASLMPSRLGTPASFFINNITPAAYYDTAGAYASYLRMQEKIRVEELLRGTTLEGVTVTAKGKSREEQLNEKYASPMFRSGDGYQFDLTNDAIAQSSQNIFTYLQGRVAGLQVSNPTGQPSVTWRGGRPAFYLDEMPVDAEMLLSIPINDIAFVKAIRPPFMGTGGANGAIVIYTRKGEDVKPVKGKGLSTNIALGYTAPRQFYSPNYANFNSSHTEKDNRTTLYWNSNITTVPGKNIIRLPFFNSDVANGFRVVVEGMTKEGLLTHIEKVIE